MMVVIYLLYNFYINIITIYRVAATNLGKSFT